MEEEEDQILLSSLGVTSANPEDIERDLLDKAKDNDANGREAGESTEEEPSNKEKHLPPSSTDQEILYNKLRAVELEIDAVASTVEQAKIVDSNENAAFSTTNSDRQEDVTDVTSVSQSFPNDMTLQHALATDRLESLKKTKAQLQKELSEACISYPVEGIEQENLLRNLVKEKTRPKRRFKEIQKSSKKPRKQHRTVSFSEDADFDSVLDAASAGFIETERDELVRKGVLTPFHKLKGFERRLEQPLQSNKEVVEGDDGIDHIATCSIERAVKSMSEAAQARPTTKLLDADAAPKLEAPTRPFYRLKKLQQAQSSESEAELRKSTKKKKRPLPGKKWRKLSSGESIEESNGKNNLISDVEEIQEAVDSGEETSFVTLEGGLKIPEVIFSKLFDYQKVGVQWLWELHCQRAGGIIGDEMGLGKTIQVLSFLGALHFSNMYRPSIIICPVTLLRQWKREANKWYPDFHVEIIHDSAQDLLCKKRSKLDESDYESEDSLKSDIEENVPHKNTKKWDSLIRRVLKYNSGLLITTYEQLRLLGDKLLDVEWGYAVLDEGHRIRNPNAEVTLVCKQLQTIHRIVMTGAPIQNKLTELWSLFDFVFPGKLGVLPVFEAEFAVPISVGGYASASPLQVSTAYRCAVVLRDLIMPYLLRRMKVDVNAQLPKKTEHVLFCSLTAEQRSIYRAFLASTEVEQIFEGNRNSLYGIDVMRKICNHPDLLEREYSFRNPDYGNPERSGKMKVVDQVLKVWKEQGHRVLFFAQTQQMLDILQSFLGSKGYNYRRMDGLTPVKQRMVLIDEFNNSDDVFIFILTTKVGGLGTNLTGANRVIIFDPDWNPSTDMQARERAWRIGQKRDVIVYRLITRGTIEEKVYHRQIYKHFLTNKILKNPQQRRFFRARDMKDLFTLKDDNESGSTETSNIFSQLSDDVTVVGKDGQDKKCIKVARATADETIDNDMNSEAPPQNKGKEKVDETDDAVDGETDILRSLFGAHGIHSAMNHDVIVNAHDGENMRLEEQASEVAQRAAEALRQSRINRSQDSISVPTWTGKFGAAGAPSSVRRKFGSTVSSQLISNSKPLQVSSKPDAISAGASAGKALSSADLLAKIRGNQARAVADGLEHNFGLASTSVNNGKSVGTGPSRVSQNLTRVQPEILIRQMCTFLQQRGGSTTSAIIVEHFKERIPSKDLPLFKNLLMEIATLQRGPNGSSWALKPEYRPD